MALTNPTGADVIRRTDIAAGNPFRTVTDSSNQYIQVIAISDDDGNPSGIITNPLYVTGDALESIDNTLSNLGTTLNPINVTGDALEIINQSIISLGSSIDPLHVQGTILDNIKISVDNSGVTLTSINTAIGTSNTILTSINSTITSSNVLATSIDTTLTSVDSTLSNADSTLTGINTELLDQGTTLDSILSSLGLGQSTSLRDDLGRQFIYTNQGELRVSQAITLADLINKYEIDGRLYSQQTATGGTIVHVPEESGIRLSVTGSNGSSSLLRTNTFYRYQAGKTVRGTFTVYHADTGQTNQIRRWGIFDDNDGVFFQLSGTTLSVVRRSSVSGSPVEETVNQASWNSDVMDGTGTSNINLDVTDGSFYQITYQWLGYGIITFLINGYIVHRFTTYNIRPEPFMRTGQLPLSWEVVNTGASTGSSMTYVCGNIVLEGGDEPANITYSAFNTTDQLITPVERPILSIRPALTYNSITNRMLMIPNSLIVSNEGGRSGYRLVMNSSLTGASWSSVNANSGMEFDTSATSGTGGETLFRGFLPGTSEVSHSVDLTKFFTIQSSGRQLRLNAFATDRDILSIYATHESVAGSSNARASITWSEIR